MESSGKFSYSLRRYPVVRVLSVIFIIGIILGSIYLIGFRTKPVPVIDSVVPPVGSPGDLVVINGVNFGNVRDMGYVEIAGSKLTASSYISWADNCIKIVLPANVQDGLLVVGTKEMRSKPALFANEVDIPVPVPVVQQVTKPVITMLSAEKLSVGELLVISGNNFGDSKNQSQVLFTMDCNNKISEADYKNMAMLTENMIPASENDFDYVSWSNTEITVRVPDGAYSGVVIVDTGREKSDPKELAINTDAGRKEYLNKKIYLVQYTADIADVVTNDISTITLRCPVPFSCPAQPEVEITETTPEPILMNYQNNLIHQITKNRNNTPKSVFKQTFVLPVFEVRSSVNPVKIGSYKNTEKNLLSGALKADVLVPSDSEAVKELCGKIIGKEKNPWNKAKLIYNYMCANFKIQDKVRKNDSDPLDLIKKESGDAFDFAVICTALLRAAEVPAYTDSGVLVNQDLTSQSHWWCEFYIDKIGWIPCDPALGAGLEYKEWTDSDLVDVKDYYFGNMDSHHIIFSRGWSQLKPFSADNKIVQQPRSFALQSIWEEANKDTAKYSSYWSVPVVKGVY
ncbi:transglutaminase domain-containing protein [Treponema bryantii]|uniref:transglutaminase domain-containing protein n=1 Tax=Treponema bryantii TaxID=163 RepID=UPI0003B6BF56|nr:transglutaminase domain-containing protein [Treponema bryantii]